MTDETVEVLEHLALAYGPAFSRQFGAAEPAAVQATWQKQLAGLTPQQIERGLRHLPEKPPNAVAFRSLCVTPRPRPQPQPGQRNEPALPTPAAVTLAHTLGKQAGRGSRQWAIDLQAKEAAGERLSRFQRRCWREGLGLDWEDCS